MGDVPRVVLGVLVVASLATIAAFVVAFFAVAASTVRRRSRRDPLAEELDLILAEIVRSKTPSPAPVSVVPGRGVRSEPTEAPGPARRDPGHEGLGS